VWNIYHEDKNDYVEKFANVFDSPKYQEQEFMVHGSGNAYKLEILLNLHVSDLATHSSAQTGT